MKLIKEIRWQGKHISLNDWYSNKHWTSRQKQKTQWHSFFSELLGNQVKLTKYKLEIEYNSRLDVDNVMVQKFLNDTMKENGWIIDDNKKYFKGMSIAVNEGLPDKTYIIRIFGEK